MGYNLTKREMAVLAKYSVKAKKKARERNTGFAGATATMFYEADALIEMLVRRLTKLEG